MLSSPSKRRKTSSTTSIAVVNDASDTAGRSGPSTSSRASYQSPTKASLSRSHPTVLARSPGRRSFEGRGKGLRQEVLLGKTNAPTSITETPIHTLPTTQQGDDGDSGNGAENAAPSASALPAENLSTVVTRAFSNTSQAPASRRSPLQPRQPSTRVDGGERAHFSKPTGEATRLKSAAAMQHTRGFRAEQSVTVEPELPPTPIQLGLSPKPDRPRGLAASSSPSSRESRRSRLRDGQVETSSPLKQKERMPPTRTEEVSEEARRTEIGGEASENDVEEAEASLDPQLVEDSRNDLGASDEIITKRRERDDLKAQLARLQAETTKLESALDAGEEAEEAFDPDLLALLSTPNLSCDPNPIPRPSPRALKDPVALDVNPIAFLRAFAPGDLRLTTTTKSSSLHGRLHQAHILHISAPPPWPPHIFHATFRVTCDVEAQRVISITGADIRPRGGAGIRELRHWIEGRLKNALHRLDAGTLIWGLGMWWKEAVARAHFFRHVDETKAGRTTTPTTSTSSSKDPAPPSYHHPTTINPAEIPTLLPYLGKSFLELLPADPYSNRASTNEARKYRQPRLLLKWDLDIDWAGEVHAQIDVAGAKVSAAANGNGNGNGNGVVGQGQEGGVREVFAALRKRQGLERAVRAVVELCEGGRGGGGAGKAGGNSRKRGVGGSGQ